MGKKKDKKKGKGAEKTAAKTEKKQNSKLKKEVAALGEDDIETIIAQIEKEEKSKQKVVEKTLVEPPTRRGNFSFIAHPDKEELILFGGEYFNGQKTFVYNDLFFYNISRNEWTLVKSPGGPTPVCGHQMVATSANKGQLWLFGGEYTSPTQSQFYHYRDLWVFHLADKKWEKIQAPGGPSARSGHRIVLSKKKIFLFGGFHDNLKDYKYFNDVYIFNLETYTWSKLEPSGTPPAPRSGCNMVLLSDGRIAIFGGYSRTRLKKDVDKGQIHNDLFILAPDKHDTTGTKWKWMSSKRLDISLRCSMPITCAPNNKAFCFGGVYDIEENEENISGEFFNDLYSLDLTKDKISSTPVHLRTKSDKNNAEEVPEDKKMEVEVPSSESTTISDDGIFTCKVNAVQKSGSVSRVAVNGQKNEFWPSPRMNCGLAVKNGVLYLYGGIVEDGDKQLTLSDFYSLNLHKLDEWKRIIGDDLASQEWYDSDSSSEESEDDEDQSGEDSSMDTD